MVVCEKELTTGLHGSAVVNSVNELHPFLASDH